MGRYIRKYLFWNYGDADGYNNYYYYYQSHKLIVYLKLIDGCMHIQYIMYMMYSLFWHVCTTYDRENKTYGVENIKHTCVARKYFPYSGKKIKLKHSLDKLINFSDSS